MQTVLGQGNSILGVFEVSHIWGMENILRVSIV